MLQFCCKFTTAPYLCAKNYQNTMRFDQVIPKNKGVRKNYIVCNVNVSVYYTVGWHYAIFVRN